jgi:hypothetical protein
MQSKILIYICALLFFFDKGSKIGIVHAQDFSDSVKIEIDLTELDPHQGEWTPDLYMKLSSPSNPEICKAKVIGMDVTKAPCSIPDKYIKIGHNQFHVTIYSIETGTIFAHMDASFDVDEDTFSNSKDAISVDLESDEKNIDLNKYVVGVFIAVCISMFSYWFKTRQDNVFKVRVLPKNNEKIGKSSTYHNRDFKKKALRMSPLSEIAAATALGSLLLLDSSSKERIRVNNSKISTQRASISTAKMLHQQFRQKKFRLGSRLSTAANAIPSVIENTKILKTHLGSLSNQAASSFPQKSTLQIITNEVWNQLCKNGNSNNQNGSVF